MVVSRNGTKGQTFNAARNGGAHFKAFDGFAKSALADIRRQCVESLGIIKAKAKVILPQCVRSGDAASWSDISDRAAIYEGVVGSILRDIDHAMSR